MLSLRWSALLLSVLALGFIFLSPTLEGVAPVWAQDLPIPQLTLWESHMATYGQKHGQALASWLATANIAAILADPTAQSVTPGLEQTYYDRTRVMYQIADYLGQAQPWSGYARDAIRVYRDLYLLKFGNVPGYWNFSTALRMDYERTGDPLSKQAAISLSLNMYCSDYSPLSSTVDASMGREVAYCILAYINAEALGEARRPRRQILVDQAYGHLIQGFVQFTWQGTTNQVSPFGVALTAQALIRDWEQTRDPRLVPILRAVCDYLWANAWMGPAAAMKYNINPGSPDPQDRAPDLNLIIAPMYAWVYAQTQDVKYRDMADALFVGGVRNAWLDGAKQFNQSYWWSFDYVRWRRGWL